MALNQITDIKTYGIESYTFDGVTISPVEQESNIVIEPVYQANSVGGRTVVAWKVTCDVLFAQNRFPDYASVILSLGNKKVPTGTCEVVLRGFTGVGDNYSLRLNLRTPNYLSAVNEGFRIETVERRLRTRHTSVFIYNKDLATQTEWAKLFTAI